MEYQKVKALMDMGVKIFTNLPQQLVKQFAPPEIIRIWCCLRVLEVEKKTNSEPKPGVTLTQSLYAHISCKEKSKSRVFAFIDASNVYHLLCVKVGKLIMKNFIPI